MKSTGQIIFNREPDGSISRKWTGGRRVAVSKELLQSLGFLPPYLNKVIKLQPDLCLRIIGMAYSPGAWTDTYVAMREGWVARAISWYWQWLSDHGPSLYRWECKWIRGRDPREGETYPKCSILGILIRPLV